MVNGIFTPQIKNTIYLLVYIKKRYYKKINKLKATQVNLCLIYNENILYYKVKENIILKEN